MKLFAFAVFLVLLLAIISTAQTATNPRTEAEQFVLDRVKNGDAADFGAVDYKGPKELTATFVRELLINADNHIEISRHGITITHAVVTGDVDLLNEEIPNDITLNAAFQGEFNATQSRFLRTLDLSGSTFDCNVDFQNATIESDFIIDNCHFNFYSSDTSPLFAGIRVERDWSMEQGVQFHAVPDFTQAVVEGKLLATGATFQAGAEFNNIRVKGDCLLREAIFGGGQISLTAISIICFSTTRILKRHR